jgi:hypothetical protein
MAMSLLSLSHDSFEGPKADQEYREGDLKRGPPPLVVPTIDLNWDGINPKRGHLAN